MNWRDEVRTIIKNNWSVGEVFTLNDIYKFKSEFSETYPDNTHIEEKIRQTLQYLRDEGTIEFIDNNGFYKRLY